VLARFTELMMLAAAVVVVVVVAAVVFASPQYQWPGKACLQNDPFIMY